MSRSWMLVAPAALALLSACATETPAPVRVAAPAPIVAAPPVYVAPVAVPEPAAAPVRHRRHRRIIRRSRSAPVAAYGGGTTSGAYVAPSSGRGLGAPAVGSEQTTSGPSAVGRQPAPAQPVGNGGS